MTTLWTSFSFTAIASYSKKYKEAKNSKESTFLKMTKLF